MSAPASLLPWPEIGSLDVLTDIAMRRQKGEKLPIRDRRPMIEILKTYVALEDGVIDAALKSQKQPDKKQDAIGKILLSMEAIDTESLTRALCLQHGCLMVNMEKIQPPLEVAKLIPLELAQNYKAVPIAVLSGTLILGVEDPFEFWHREYISIMIKLKIELVMVRRTQIDQKLSALAKSLHQSAEEFKSLAKAALQQDSSSTGFAVEDEGGDDMSSQIDATIVGLVNKIISDAVDMGASDIHLECFPGMPLARIRFRRDGSMVRYSDYSATYHRAVVSRIKIMASLNIAETRLPQDGKITFARHGRPRIDLRVATIPTVRSIENVTIRLLHGGEPIPLDKLDLCPRDLTVMRKMVARPHGLILVCGPTGSGKTTTLHSAIRELNRPETKIWTAEDPIEIVQPDICQVQVNARIGWTFATALRAFLRADPDVIMVGEMRDGETAGMGLEAAMTGHLVLSTLHTNSACETTSRLLDLGIDPFNLADALLGVLAQRLARRLCRSCRKPEPISDSDLEALAAEYYFSAYQKLPDKSAQAAVIGNWEMRFGGREGLTLYCSSGCEVCNGEGYKGRVSLVELLEVTPTIRQAISKKIPAAEMVEIAVAEGMRTLKQDGIEKALLGLTDMTQVRSTCV